MMTTTTHRLTAVLILAALCFFKSSIGANDDHHQDQPLPQQPQQQPLVNDDNCVAYLYEDGTVNLLSSDDPRGPIVYGYDAQNLPKHRYPDPNTECIFKDGDALLHLSCAEERMMILRGPVQDHRDYRATYLYHRRTINPRSDGDDVVVERGLGIHGEDPAETKLQSATRPRCTREVEPIFIDVSKGDLSQGQRYQTGYFVTPVDFLRVMEFKLAANGNLVATATLTPAASLTNEIKPAQTPRYGWGLAHHAAASGKLLDYESVYSLDNQREVFEGQWPELEDIEERINEEQKLVRTQLISDEDFYYHNEKTASYFYENTVPVWKSVAEGNWARVGRIMREIAAQTDSEFELGATSYGAYRQPGRRGQGRLELADTEELGGGYLRVPVPWVLQRYMVDKRNPRRGIVFHVINNPFLTPEEVREYMAERPRCRMVECHMAHREFAYVEQGFTYCCAIDDDDTLKEHKIENESS
ncbi:uncharacterized protein LOC106654681 isoform X2 [Trichogramma pretiosum]|uniref:uncharacterized protein LOC106654681 isoform X2 n=1 Tax=Trichogramma pretiosum TaxID=7493 RepID=UPI0006C94B26|nr:uncharacterized protein LOC106654681 isoform X2 [Trichogramma pretiosum]